MMNVGYEGVDEVRVVSYYLMNVEENMLFEGNEFFFVRVCGSF